MSVEEATNESRTRDLPCTLRWGEEDRPDPQDGEETLMEVRPCVGWIADGDFVVSAEPERIQGYLTVRRAKDGEPPLGQATTNSHRLGFVAFERRGVSA